MPIFTSINTIKTPANKKVLSYTALALATLTLTACQSMSASPVLKRADHVFETTGIGKSKTIAQKQALYTANKQCGLRSAIILSDTTTYNGVLDEKTGRLIDQGVGVVGAVFGVHTPTIARNDDYEYHIRFRCQ